MSSDAKVTVASNYLVVLVLGVRVGAAAGTHRYGKSHLQKTGAGLPIKASAWK
jgi:hypothetical protein